MYENRPVGRFFIKNASQTDFLGYSVRKRGIKMTNTENITEEYIDRILKNKIITAQDIYAIKRTTQNRQKYINKICLAFADNDMRLKSINDWEAFYSVICRLSSFSDKIKGKAFSNAYNNQIKGVREATAKNKSNEGR